MAASIRLYVKRKLRLDRLNFKQREMYEIGEAGLKDVKRRIAAAQGPQDAPAKPLGRGYAIWKTKQGLGNRRNLRVTGAMLDNLSLRTVTENSAKANFTTVKQREKAQANTKKEAFVVFSPANKKVVYDKAGQVFKDRVKRLAISERTGIDVG